MLLGGAILAASAAGQGEVSCHCLVVLMQSVISACSLFVLEACFYHWCCFCGVIYGICLPSVSKSYFMGAIGNESCVYVVVCVQGEIIVLSVYSRLMKLTTITLLCVR